MIAVYIIIYSMASILYLVTINKLLNLVSNGHRYKKIGFVVGGIQILSSAINAVYTYIGSSAVSAFMAIVISYLLIWVCMLIFHTEKLKTIYVTSVYLFIDSIIITLVDSILLLTSIKCNANIIMQLTSISLSTLSLFLVSRLNEKKDLVRMSLAVIPRNIYYLILAILFLMGNLTAASGIQFRNTKLQIKLICICVLATIPFLIVIIIYLMFNCISKQYYENSSALMEQQVNNQIEYYKKTDKLTQDLKSFRHDYKNHMICLQSILENGQYEEAINYVKNITNQEIIDLDKFSTGNHIADSILNDKSELASKNNCKIVFNGFIYDDISPADICTILSNALDNAIEACAKITASEPGIIEVKCAVAKKFQFIRISNPNPRNTTSLKTAKADSTAHGFGLYNIKSTVEKLGGKIEISEYHPQFTLEIQFKVR